MYDGTADQLNVTFPATDQFVRLGRATVSGLALRLGVDLSVVERLRLAVDASLQPLLGPGVINLQASWEPGHLAIDLENATITITPERTAQLTEQLSELVDDVRVSATHVVLAIEDINELD